MANIVEERKQTYTKYAEQNECTQLDQIPWIVVFDVEHDKMVVSKRIEGTQDESSRQRTEERAPERLQWKVVAHLHDNKNSQSNLTASTVPRYNAQGNKVVS